MKTASAALLFIGTPFIAGAVGAIASANAQSFYAQLVQPAWAPPPSVFGPVWTALYFLMGLAAFLVWKRFRWEGAPVALALFLAHLVVNALWSWLFFRWQLGLASSADITLLLVMVGTLVVLFFRLRPISGWLLLPYLAWVSFAAALNFTLVRLNPQLLG